MSVYEQPSRPCMRIQGEQCCNKTHDCMLLESWPYLPILTTVCQGSWHSKDPNSVPWQRWSVNVLTVVWRCVTLILPQLHWVLSDVGSWYSPVQWWRFLFVKCYTHQDAFHILSLFTCYGFVWFRNLLWTRFGLAVVGLIDLRVGSVHDDQDSQCKQWQLARTQLWICRHVLYTVYVIHPYYFILRRVEIAWR